MKRKSILFRELLEDVLPIPALPTAEQLRVSEALASADAAKIEAVALETLANLVRSGHLRRVEEILEGDEKVVRYKNLETTDTIILRLPAGEEEEGIYKIPLPLREWHGATSLDQVRSLFNLHNKILTQDSQLLRGQGDILRQVMLTTREMTGCQRVSFYPLSPPDATELPRDNMEAEPYDEELVRDWVMDRRFLVYLPDLPAQINTVTGELYHPFASLAMVPIGEPKSRVYGVLHAWSTQPAFFNDSRQGILSLISEFGTELLQRAQVLGNLVFVDSATQVYNRSYFNLQLENEIARAKREEKSMALAIVDIDDFKNFNSRFGYEGGNQVLSYAAQVLKRGLRPFDSVARWGGEEFALILTAPVTREDAHTVCERLRHTVQLSRFTITGLSDETTSVQITITIGGAVYPADGATNDALWRAANAALVGGKKQGKNRVIFSPDFPGFSQDISTPPSPKR